MRPSSVEILRAVLANLDEMILPQLEGVHARSAGANTRMLLEHVVVRLQDEGQDLATDNAEKREALLDAANAVGGAAHPPRGDVFGTLSERLDGIPAGGGYVSIATLTDESERLRALTNDWILALYRHRDELGTEAFEAAHDPIRRQLRAQVNREAALVAPIAVDQIFANRDA